MAEFKIKIPDWAEGRNIFVFADTELIARIIVTETSYNEPIVKTERCNGCGDCCSTGLNPGTIDYMKRKLKHYNRFASEPCPFMEPDGCGLKQYIPLSCARSYCGGLYPNCTEVMR